MTASIVFSIANSIAILMWLLMILFPRWKVTQSFVDFKIIPIVLSILYIFYIGQTYATTTVDFSTLSSVMHLFTIEVAAMAGWMHFLAFDLLIGMWILKTAQKSSIKHWLVIPCLIASFMLGPIGFLMFTIIKTIKK